MKTTQLLDVRRWSASSPLLHPAHIPVTFLVIPLLPNYHSHKLLLLLLLVAIVVTQHTITHKHNKLHRCQTLISTQLAVCVCGCSLRLRLHC